MPAYELYVNDTVTGRGINGVEVWVDRGGYNPQHGFTAPKDLIDGYFGCILSSGIYPVKLSKEYYYPLDYEIKIISNDKLETRGLTPTTLPPPEEPPIEPPPPPPGKGNLEVHAYEDGSEVEASVEIVGVGTRTTPFVEALDPGSYGLNITFRDAVKTDTVVIVASETTRVDYRYTAAAAPSPIPPDFPFKRLESFPRLCEIAYNLWKRIKI